MVEFLKVELTEIKQGLNCREQILFLKKTIISTKGCLCINNILLRTNLEFLNFFSWNLIWNII
jgi:hypothetical protein